MKDHIFYRRYANTPLKKRDLILPDGIKSPLLGMTLDDVYKEIHDIDATTRSDLIRKEKLLKAVEKFLK